MARSRFGALGPYNGLPYSAPVLYTPLNETQTREPREPHTHALACPSVAKCESALGEDLFAHKDPRNVVRVGQPEQLERELEAYETLRSIAGDDFRALKAELVTPTEAPFDPPHLLIERYAPLGKVPVTKNEVPAASVWALASMLDRMHTSGVAHGGIDKSSVGVVSGPKGPSLVLAPRGLVVSPFRGDKQVEAGLDSRGLRVRIEPAKSRAATKIAGHEETLAAMQRDRDGMMDLFFDVLNEPRDEDARVWASLNAGTAGTRLIGPLAPADAADATAVKSELGRAEALARAALSLAPGGLTRALVKEAGAIREALSSPREVPSGLTPRVKSVAHFAKIALGVSTEPELGPAEAHALADRIRRMIDADDAISEFRGLLNVAAEPSERSVVDGWLERLDRLEKERSVFELVELCNKIAEWSRVTAPLEIERHKASLDDHYEPGVHVGEALTVFANKTSAYSDAERKHIIGSCERALRSIDALATSILDPFRNGAWDRIRVLVSKQLHYGGPGCDYSAASGFAHRESSAGAKCPPRHLYKSGSIEVKYPGSEAASTAFLVQHKLIHALHFRNERARGAELEYRHAMDGIRALLEEYATWGSQPQDLSSDTYAAKNVYEFLVGVTQVLAGSTRFRRLRDFVQVRPELRAHARVVLNAPAEPGWCTLS